MRRIKVVFSALAIVAVSAIGSFAADMDQIIPASQEDAYTPVEIGSGWYIRGDISYNMANNYSGTYRTYGPISAGPPVLNGYTNNDYDAFSSGRAGHLSVGVGYQLNSYFRTDITTGYVKSNVTGRDTAPVPCTPAFPGAVGCRSEDASSVTLRDTMLNVYGDFGNYYGFTPYLGAGVGVSHVRYGTLTNTAICTDATGADIGTAGCGYTASHAGATTWRATWALMAGTSYDLSKNLKLDLGYRYARTAGGNMFKFSAAEVAAGATGIQGKDSGFSTSQIKAGLRYEIW